MIRHLDLFSGIGGFARAVEWCGGETVGFVEWEAWCRRVCFKHWPQARYFGDIRTVTADDLRGLGRIDLITGGYPCQPFSLAGERRGADDPRHLWPEMRRVINELRPTYVLAENVDGHVTMGLDTVLAEMEADGYTCRPVVVPAGGVEAPHLRHRVWIMAHAERSEGSGRSDITEVGRWEGYAKQVGVGSGREATGLSDARGPRRVRADHEVRAGRDTAHAGSAGIVADTDHTGCQERWEREPAGEEHTAAQCLRGAASDPDTEARRVRCGWAPGQTGQHARLGQAEPNPDAHGEREPQQEGAEPGQWGRTGHVCDGRCGRGHGPSEAQWSVDLGADGVSPGLVRRSAPGSIDPDRMRWLWNNGLWESGIPRVTTDEVDRRKKVRAAGNAIVPQVAYAILRVMLGVDDE